MTEIRNTLRFLWSAAGLERSTPFRVGVLIGSDPVERWVVECIRGLSGIEGLALELLPVSGAPQPAASPLLGQLERQGGDAQLLERVRLDYDALDLSVAAPLVLESGGRLQAASREAASARDYDALLVLGIAGLQGPCEGLCASGVFQFQLNGQALGSGSFGLFRGLAEGRLLTELTLTRHEQEFTAGVPVRAWTISHNSGIFHGRNSGALASLSLVAGLEFLRCARGWESKPGIEIETGAGKPPGSFAVARFLAAAALRKLSRKVSGVSGVAGEWFVALRPHQKGGLPTAEGPEWRELQGFPGHGAADPFLFEWGGKRVLFYEDIPASGLGRLAGIEVLPNGHTAESFVLLERPEHLSYPCVFEHGGEVFMIPESSGNGTVELHRAVEFPHRWELDSVLVRDAGLLDTTPFHHQGRWYFFAMAGAPGNAAITLLFFSDELRGNWRLHPASPITTDVRASRPGGRLISDGPRTYRPLQNGWPSYGASLEIHEVLELSPESFREAHAGSIPSSWREGMAGTHTFARSASLEAIDGRPGR